MKIASLLKNLLQRSRAEAEMSDELRFHIEMRADDLMSRGDLTREEALRQARLEFGGLEKYKEEGRHARGFRLFDEIRNDLRYGIRQLSKAPIFTFTGVITLAIAIAANTTIFTFVNAVMLKPLPVPNPEQLRQLEWTSAQPTFVRSYSGYTWHDDERKASFSHAIFEYIRDHTTTFSGLLGFGGQETMNLWSNELAAETQVISISDEYFTTLGVRPVLGRTIEPGDSESDVSQTPVVISYGLWQRAFGKASSVVGRSITLNRTPAIIVGVLPENFFSVRPMALVTTDVYIPFGTSIESRRPRYRELSAGRFNLLVFGRLSPGISDETARLETEQLMRQAIETNPPDKPYDPPQVRLADGSRGMDSLRHSYSEGLALMMGVVGMILLIGCANLAGLLFARAETRRREVGTRLALGAARGRLIRQHLTESLLLSALGTVVAIPVSLLLVDWLPSVIPDPEFRLGFDLSFDSRIFFFSVVLCIASSILFGLAPALRATRVDILGMLKSSSERIPARLRSGRILVSIQVALSLLLLVGASLCLRTLHNLQSVPLGFDPTNILTFSFDPSTSGYKDEPLLNMIQDTSRRIQQIPGVRSVSFSSFGVLTGTRTTAKVCSPGKPTESTHTLAVSPRFFETMRIRMVAGRDFNSFDRAGAKKTVVVNETFAKRFLAGRESIGASVLLLPPKDQVTCPGEGDIVEVIGIVADTKYDNLRQTAPPTVYFSYFQGDTSWVTFEIATERDPNSLLPAVRRSIASIDPNLFMLEVRPQSTYVKLFLLPERVLSTLVTSIAVIALFLACVGIYGTIAYAVSRRIPEIGVRMALGASRADVLRMTFRESLTPVGIGVILGLTGAVLITPVLESMLYGVTPGDPLSLAVALVFLSAAAIAAAVIPARRASRVDPMTALRYE